jgi:predicted amidohydrolase
LRPHLVPQRAVAIQFQVYVLAPAQAGTHNAGRVSWGESLAFSPCECNDYLVEAEPYSRLTVMMISMLTTT